MTTDEHSEKGEQPTAENKTHSPELDLKQAMVIEDSMPLRRMLSKILSTIKIKVLEAENGKIAMDHLAKHPPERFDIIICDLMMPVMDGAAFITAAKSTYADKMPPIVICSSRSDKEAIQMVRKLGVASYILKPFKTDTVLNKVREILEQPEDSPGPESDT